MRIENQGSQGVTDGSLKSVSRSTGQDATTGQELLAKATSDQVSLSGASNLLKLAKSLPSDRQSVIGALTSQYNNGTYKPSSAATSRSLVESLKN